MQADSSNEYGHFHPEEVEVAWTTKEGKKDREVRLLKDFTYIDPNGRSWTAPEGKEVDGASIPPPLWNYWIGTPFIGNYRRASVVHDYECDVKTAESSHVVHRMFYDACLAGGVNEARAQIMYWAVRTFGPEWGDEDASKVLTEQQYKELVEMDAFFKSKNFNENTTVQEIEATIEVLNMKLEQQ